MATSFMTKPNKKSKHMFSTFILQTLTKFYVTEFTKISWNFTNLAKYLPNVNW